MISTILWFLAVLVPLLALIVVPLILFSKSTKHNDSVPASDKIKFIKQNSPPSQSKGWELCAVENGLRIWQKNVNNGVPWFSGLLYGCSAIIPSSLQEIMSAVEDFKLVQDWDPMMQHATMVTVSPGHDVVSVTHQNNNPVIQLLTDVLQLCSQDTNVIHSRYWKTRDSSEGWVFATCMQNSLPSLESLWYSMLVSPLDTDNSSDDPECLVTIVTAPVVSILFGPPSSVLTSCRLAGLKDYFASAKMEGFSASTSNDEMIRSSTEDMLENVDFGGENRGLEAFSSGSSVEQFTTGEFLHVNASDGAVVRDNSNTEVLLQTMLQAYNAQAGTDGWTLIGNIKGVEITKRSAQPGEKPCDTFKGVGLVNVPIHYVLAYVFSLDFRGEWDDLFQTGKDIAILHPLTRVSWMEYKAVWPTSARDFCNMVVLREVSEGLYAVAAEATEHQECPPGKNVVRAELLLGGFLVRELSSDPPCCQVAYISRVDLKGNLPLRLVNRVTQSQPQAVAVLRDKLEARYSEEAKHQSVDESMSEIQSFGVELWVELMKAKEAKLSGSSTLELGKSWKTPEKSRRRRSPEARKRQVTGDADSIESESTSVSEEQAFTRELAAEERAAQKAEISMESCGPQISDENLELPFDRHRVDYKTLGNQASATLMGEIVLASKVEISVSEEPNLQIDKEGEWSYQSIEKDVVILRKVSPGQKIHSFLGKGIIKTSPIAVWEAARNHMTRHVYDKTLKKTKILKQLDDTSKLLYLHHETAQCFVKQARDFVVLTVERVEPEKYVIAGVSVDYPDCDEVKDLIRGKVFASGWVIEPVLQDGHLYSMVSYLSQIDFGGIIPTRLLNYVARRQPLCIAYLREYLEKFKNE